MTIDTLEAAGLTHMDDSDIAAFLSNQRVGVLGLPTKSGPYMIPLSFGYDGDSSLYFTFIGGSASRKQRLTEAAADATVLVYKVESMFHWESVLLQGNIEAVPESEWAELRSVLRAWRPDHEDAFRDDDVTIYRFHIDKREELRHAGLPPRVRAGGTAARPRSGRRPPRSPTVSRLSGFNTGRDVPLSMPTPVIVDAVRTPQGKEDGALAGVRSEDLSVPLINQLLASTGVEAEDVDDLPWGCAQQRGERATTWLASSRCCRTSARASPHRRLTAGVRLPPKR